MKKLFDPVWRRYRRNYPKFPVVAVRKWGTERDFAGDTFEVFYSNLEVL